MRMASIGTVTYAYSNEEGEAYNLSTAKIYAEMAKPLAEQSGKATHIPVRIEGEDPYEMWKARAAT